MAIPLILIGGVVAAAYVPNIINGFKDYYEIQLKDDVPHAPTSAGLRGSFNAEAFANSTLLTNLPPELRGELGNDVSTLTIDQFKDKYADYLQEASVTTKARPSMYDLRDMIPFQGATEIVTDAFAPDKKPILSQAANTTFDHTYTVYNFHGRDGIVLEGGPVSADTGRITSVVVNNITSDNKLKMFAPSAEPEAGRGSVVWGWDEKTMGTVAPPQVSDAVDVALKYQRDTEVGLYINKQNFDYVPEGSEAFNSNTVTKSMALERGDQVPAQIEAGVVMDGKNNTVPGLEKSIDAPNSAIDPSKNTITDLYNAIQRNEQGLWQTLKEEPTSKPVPAPAPAPFN